MAGSLILVPFYVCVLGLMLCGSVADSRAVFFRELHEPAVPEDYCVDDSPQTFTMQDHFNYLRERELERRRRGDSTQLSALGTTSHIEKEEPLFVSDYCHTGANTKNSISAWNGRMYRTLNAAIPDVVTPFVAANVTKVSMDQSSSLLFLKILFVCQLRRGRGASVASITVGIIQILTKALWTMKRAEPSFGSLGRVTVETGRRQCEATPPAGDPALRYSELEVVRLWHSALVARRTMWLHSVFLPAPLCLLILGCAPGQSCDVDRLRCSFFEEMWSYVCDITG